ncbi:unnamed protein product [Lepidochelys kempii]
MANMSGLLGPGSAASSSEAAASADDWTKTLGQTLEKVVLSHAESDSCHKLRLFAGEEEFEPWLEHTTEMLQEWAVPDAEKRRCLIERLGGPALDVIRTLKLIDPGVSVKDCLEALEHTFGSVGLCTPSSNAGGSSVLRTSSTCVSPLSNIMPHCFSLLLKGFLLHSDYVLARGEVLPLGGAQRGWYIIVPGHWVGARAGLHCVIGMDPLEIEPGPCCCQL